jgi:hypothetical protein
MRALNFGDTFAIARLGKKVGVETLAKMYQDAIDSVKNVTDDAEKVRLLNAKAMDYIGVLLSGYGNCEADVLEIMANVSGKTVKQIKEMSFDDLEQWIEEFKTFNKPEQVIGFFTKAFKSMR